jgi:hypothetical protein
LQKITNKNLPLVECALRKTPLLINTLNDLRLMQKYIDRDCRLWASQLKI